MKLVRTGLISAATRRLSSVTPQNDFSPRPAPPRQISSSKEGTTGFSGLKSMLGRKSTMLKKEDRTRSGSIATSTRSARDGGMEALDDQLGGEVPTPRSAAPVSYQRVAKLTISLISSMMKVIPFRQRIVIVVCGKSQRKSFRRPPETAIPLALPRTSRPRLMAHKIIYPPLPHRRTNRHHGSISLSPKRQSRRATKNVKPHWQKCNRHFRCQLSLHDDRP